MKFISKFFFLSLFLICCGIFDIYFADKIIFDLTFLECKINFGAGVFVGCIAILLFFLSVIKSLFRSISNFFSNKTSDKFDRKCIENLAKAIVSEGSISLKFLNYARQNRKFKPLINAIVVNKNLAIPITKTGIPEIDIYILKRDLKTCLENKDLQNGMNLAQVALSCYTNRLSIIWKEFFEIALMLKKDGINLSFDPRKFKYNLYPNMIEEYIVATKLIDLEKEQSIKRKFKILDRLFNEYPSNSSVSDIYLTLIIQNPDFYKLKKIKAIFYEIFSRKPNRNFAKYVLMLNRNDAFEFAQEITSNINNVNLEKLWFLFEIATSLKMHVKAKQLFKSISKLDKKICS